MIDVRGSAPDVVRAAFSRFPSGVVAIGALIGDVPEVLVASTFTVGVSLEPPLALLAVRRESSTWPLLQQAEHLGVSVLGHAHRPVVRQLAHKDRSQRLAGVAYTAEEDSAVFIHGAALWLDCTIYSQTDVGDHIAVLLEVTSFSQPPDSEPLVFFQSEFHGIAALPEAVVLP